MPSSSKEGKDIIYQWCLELQDIKKILDVGVGEGTYIKFFKKRKVFTESHWTGIEVWKPYIEKFSLIEKYNLIINKDVRTITFEDQYDLIFMGDVLEHMTKEEAIELVKKLSKISRYCIISIPIVHYPQDEIFNNPFEKHVKDDWSHKEVLESFPNIIKTFRGKEIGCYLLRFK